MEKATPLKLEIMRQGRFIKDVCKKSGVNMNYISMACNGRIKLNREHQKKIAGALRCSVKKIFPS